MVREERDGHDDVVEAVLGEQPDDVLHHRPVRDRHHRLRLVAGQRPQPRPLPTGQDHCLHGRCTIGSAPSSVLPTRLRSASWSLHHRGRLRSVSRPGSARPIMVAAPSCRAAVGERGPGHRDVPGGRVVAEAESADREEPGDDLDDVAQGAGVQARDEHEAAGSANISASVPAFPTHCTSMRRAPAAASTRVTTLSAASRASTRTPTQSGTSPLMMQAERPGDEHDPVRDRVEDLADLAALVEVAGDVAVDPVGRAEDREQDARLERVVLAEQEPEEHGDAGEPQRPRWGSGWSRPRGRARARARSWAHSVGAAAVPPPLRCCNWTAARVLEDRADALGEDRLVRRMVPVREVALDAVEVGHDRVVVVALVDPEVRPEAVLADLGDQRRQRRRGPRSRPRSAPRSRPRGTRT